MWNVGCAMLGVGCGMLNVECGMWHVACEMLSGHAGCLYQKTRIAPMRTDGSFHGFFTLAPLPTAWF